MKTEGQVGARSGWCLPSTRVVVVEVTRRIHLDILKVEPRQLADPGSGLHLLIHEQIQAISKTIHCLHGHNGENSIGFNISQDYCIYQT